MDLPHLPETVAYQDSSHVELADSYAKAQKVIGTLFPSSSLEELSLMTRQQLLTRLQSSTTSPSTIEAGSHNDLQVLEPSLEQNFTWDEVSENDSETSRVADDINGLAFSQQSLNASYLGLSSVPTILRVIAHLSPHVQQQVPKGPQAWRSPSTLGASPNDMACSQGEEIPLINAYFTHVHPIIPMVDEADFRQRHAQDGTAEGEAGSWLALLNMVLAMGSMASDSTHLTGHNFFYKRALPHLDISSFGSGHLHMVQALALYSGMILHFLNKPNMAVAVMGATIRMAIAMGLHREDRLIQLPLISPDEVNEFDNDLLAWKDSLHMFLAHREQCPPNLNIARAILWWRWITTRLTLYRPGLLVTVLRRKPWDEVKDEERIHARKCIEIAKEGVDLMSLDWSPNQIICWNSAWNLFQMTLVLVLGLMSDKQEAEEGHYDEYICRAIELFARMEPMDPGCIRSRKLLQVLFDNAKNVEPGLTPHDADSLDTSILDSLDMDLLGEHTDWMAYFCNGS
ncbi:hypothetical protein FSARC_7016 [Fusarium sarcochroum]|uniref:Xylanolytic transcriptional activator regulatory domain-containing protein n=1 Tax=Fusarium sarcochroum TaxID=1208366 RepID=A0A8H4X8Q3_9HYPO|nr:hypothetical protein FSARC_7016 [Fusarium sarcochroum]